MLKMTKKGFTLIELMIVVAIIGILAAIAIPNFIRYQLKSKQAESKAVLGGVKTSQESFRGEYDNYMAATGPNPAVYGGVSKQPWLQNPCPAGCGRATPNACTEFECAGYRPAGAVYYTYNTTSIQFIPPAIGIPEWSGCGDSDLDGDGTAGSVGFCTDNAMLGACGLAPTCATNVIPQFPNEMTNHDTANF